MTQWDEEKRCTKSRLIFRLRREAVIEERGALSRFTVITETVIAFFVASWTLVQALAKRFLPGKKRKEEGKNDGAAASIRFRFTRTLHG